MVQNVVIIVENYGNLNSIKQLRSSYALYVVYNNSYFLKDMRYFFNTQYPLKVMQERQTFTKPKVYRSYRENLLFQNRKYDKNGGK